MQKKKALLSILLLTLLISLVSCATTSENFEAGIGVYDNFYSSKPLDQPTVSSTQAHEGTYSLRFYDYSASGSGSTFPDQGTFIADEDAVSISFWFYNDDNTYWTCQIIEDDETDYFAMLRFVDYGAEDLIDVYNGSDYTTIAVASSYYDEWIHVRCTANKGAGWQQWSLYNATGTQIGSTVNATTFASSVGSSSKEDLNFEMMYYGTGYFYIDDIQTPYDSDPFPSSEEEDEDYWWDDEDLTNIMSWVVILCIMFVPSWLMGSYFAMGKWGYIIGLSVGTGLGYMIYQPLVPIWLVFLVAVGVVGYLIFSAKGG